MNQRSEMQWSRTLEEFVCLAVLSKLCEDCDCAYRGTLRSG